MSYHLIRRAVIAAAALTVSFGLAQPAQATELEANDALANVNSTNDSALASQTDMTSDYWSRFGLDRINAHRQSNGLAPLAPSAEDRAGTAEHSEWMARTESLEHARITRGTENIAFASDNYEVWTGEDIADRVVNTWINSPGHNRNLLDANSTEGAVSFAPGNWDGSNGYYATFRSH